MKPKLGTVLRVLVSVLALVLIPWFLRDKLHEAFRILSTEVDFRYFALAALIYYGSLVFMTFRSRAILAAQKINLGFIEATYVSFIGIFYNLFLPSAVGGDIMKAVYLSRYQSSKAVIISCLVMDRLSGLFVVLFMTFLSAGLLYESWNFVPHWLSWIMIAAMLGVGVGTLVRPEWIPFVFSKMRFLPHALQEKVNRFYDSLSSFFHNRPLLIRSIAVTLIAQSCFITAYYFIGLSLGAQIPYLRYFILIPMLTIMSMAPSINGLGVREAGALFLFKLYMPDERALAMTVLVDVIVYSCSFVGGFWYLIRGLMGGDRLKRD